MEIKGLVTLDFGDLGSNFQILVISYTYDQGGSCLLRIYHRRIGIEVAQSSFRSNVKRIQGT